MIKKKVILFDLDDTLIYTFQSSYRKVEYALKRMNKKAPNIDEFKSIYGIIKFPKCIELWISKKEIDEFLVFYEQSKLLYKYESICELDKLNEFLMINNLRTGLVTNTPEDRIHYKVEKVFSDKFFFEYQYPNAEKPNPIGIEKAINFFGVKKEDIVFVGDSSIDYETATSADVDFLAVTTGVTNASSFENLGLNKRHIFPSINDLIENYVGVKK